MEAHAVVGVVFPHIPQKPGITKANKPAIVPAGDSFAPREKLLIAHFLSLAPALGLGRGKDEEDAEGKQT